MKKNFMMVALAALFVSAATCVAGCSMQDFVEKFTGAASGSAVSGDVVLPEYVSGQAVEIEDYDPLALVELGQYKGVEVDCTVSDEEIDAELDSLLQQHPIELEGTAKNGDEVNIDYSGKQNGKKFDGGTAKDQTITLGSSGFIDGFDDAVIGMKTGEKKDAKMKFPDDYHDEKIAGKNVVFTIKLNYIVGSKNMVDDAYIKKNTEQKTLEDWKAATKKSLADVKKSGAATTAMDMVFKTSKVKSIPPTLLLAEKEMTRTNFLNTISQQGIDLQTALSMQGKTEAEFEDMLLEQAKSTCEAELICEAIAATEKLDVSDQAVQKYIDDMVVQSGRTLDDIKESFVQYYGTAEKFEDYMKTAYVYNTVAKFVGDNAKIKE
ncbi:MAG: trigger factor [Eubacterium sp.]|nr:trigger factor [Eubacterium sp.]